MSPFRRPSHRLRTRCTSRWLIPAMFSTWHGVRMTSGSREIIHTNSTGTANTLGGHNTAIARKLGDVKGR